MLKMPPMDQKGTVNMCELSEDMLPKPGVKIQPLENAKGRLLLGGGGFDSSFYNDKFLKSIKDKGEKARVAFFLSATKSPKEAASAFFSLRDKGLGGKVKSDAIFTTPDNYRRLPLEKVGPPAKSVVGDGISSVTLKESRPDPNGNTSTFTMITRAQPKDPAQKLETVEEKWVSTNPNRLISNDVTHLYMLGGWMDGYNHLTDTLLMASAHQRYMDGAEVLASSAGTNFIGANMSMMFPMDKIPKDEDEVFQYYQDESKFRRAPTYGRGGQITNDFNAVSHYSDPRIIAALFGGKVEETTTSNNGVTTVKKVSTAFNPYALLDPMKELATMPNSPVNKPMFGIPENSYMVYEKGVATYHAPTKDHRMVVMDPRFPATDRCQFWYITDGASFDLASGKITSAPAEAEIAIGKPHGAEGAVATATHEQELRKPTAVK